MLPSSEDAVSASRMRRVCLLVDFARVVRRHRKRNPRPFNAGRKLDETVVCELILSGGPGRSVATVVDLFNTQRQGKLGIGPNKVDRRGAAVLRAA